MNFKSLCIFFILALTFASLASCEEDTTNVGSVIATGEVQISIETIPYDLEAKAIRIEKFDSKTGNLMVGNITSENYGSLDCSFITKLMCAANLQIADSIFNLPDFIDRVDSCKLILGAQRDEIIGDSLAPQRLTVYKLTSELPSSSEISNDFDPSPYYNPNDPFAVKNYTVSGIADSDSSFYRRTYVDITVDLPLQFGKDIFQTYKDSPEIFQWPQSMAKYFLPGLYVKSTFGNGCIANINSLFVGVYYYTLSENTTVNDEGESVTTVKHVANVAIPFMTSPEVLSSNNISYVPSQNIEAKNSTTNPNGEVVVTTPGGYIAEFEFPAEDLIRRFYESESHLSTVNDLMLYIPGEEFEEGLDVAQNLLMIKSSDYEEFFANNKVPDNLNSFIGTYDPDKGQYFFSSLRSYFLNLLQKGTITEEDITFSLIPVEIETQSSSSYYNTSTYVTKCTPLTSRPTLTLLKTNESEIVFSFSTQLID